jgi:hypothetical protein
MRHTITPLSLVLAAALAVPAAAQSMGEAAAKERERREKLRQGKPAPKVITEEDLRGSGRPRGTVSNPAATEATDPNSPAAAASPAPEGAHATAAGSREKSDEEQLAQRQAEWRERMKRAQDDVNGLTQRVEQLQVRLNDMSGNLYGAGRSSLLSEMESTRSLLETARQTLANLEEEGRRGGFRL